jgi:quinol monooxygenase YgiN
MLIVSGQLFLRPGTRDQFLACCEPSIRMARRAPGCLDFAVSADTIEPDRANVYEAWTDAQSLLAFRETGADDPSGRVPARGVSPQPRRAEVRATQRATADSRVGTVSLRDCRPSSCM